jgi:alpha-glucoside transport system substrate-binding protein
MKIYRFAILALLALVLAVGAAACGGGDDGDDGGGGGGGGDGQASDVSGSISVMGIWSGQEQASFQAVIDAFTEQNPGVTVNYTSAGDQLPTVLSTAVEGGNPPDLAAVAQPGLIQGFVEQGAVQPLDFMADTVEQNFGESIVQVGSFEDQFYGLLFKAANKSTVWYNTQTFADAGVEPPEDWEAFIEAGETIKASGVAPYSIAAANGWTLTDLFENIYLRTAGPEMYDQLSRHEIPWTDESVKEALREMARIVEADNMAGGVEGALQTDFPTSVSNVLAESPKAAIVIEGDFVPGVVETPLQAGEGFNVFPFPSINDSPPSVVGGGDIFIMFNDSPAAQAFMEYLATPEAAQVWAERGGFSSANKELDPAVYPDEILRTTAGAIAEAEAFRFDLSDLQPSAFGATEGQGLWKLFQDFVRNPDNVDGIAQQMEQAATRAFGR